MEEVKLHGLVPWVLRHHGPRHEGISSCKGGKTRLIKQLVLGLRGRTGRSDVVVTFEI